MSVALQVLAKDNSQHPSVLAMLMEATIQHHLDGYKLHIPDLDNVLRGPWESE